MTLTPEDMAEWNQWLATRPPAIRAVAERLPPWKLYLLRPSGHRVCIHSYGEKKDGGVSLTVVVSGKYNLVQFEREVFGIDPDNLSECDLPAEGEPVGAMLSQEQVEENIDEIRLDVRPDLWERAADGSVVRKGRN